jgi:PTS system mannose-specific IIB component
MQEVLKLAAPPDLTVDVYSVEEALKVFGPDTSRGATMVLMKSPETARRLYEGGLDYDELNIGGIGSAPGRKNIFKNISASKEQIETLKNLLAQGVEITLLTVPGEKSKSFRDLADKL